MRKIQSELDAYLETNWPQYSKGEWEKGKKFKNVPKFL